MRMIMIDKNEDIFAKEIKSAKVIYPKDFDKISRYQFV